MPHVTSLATDSVAIDLPAWEDMLHALRALDAKENTIVVLAPASPAGAPAGEAHMSIGGGNGRYLASDLGQRDVLERGDSGRRRAAHAADGGWPGG